MNVLVVGASIAGPATAYWLGRAGHRVTLVERAPTLRRGGHAVDIRGAALDVVDAMGLRERLRPLETDTESNAVVDAAGRTFGRMARGFGVIDPGDVEILRGDLASVLFEQCRPYVDARFGDSPVAFADDGRGVDVTFASGREERFDLVVGADGLHSAVRRIAFGPEERFTHDLGAVMAIFAVPNELGMRREQLSFNELGRIATVKCTNGDRELRVCVFFMAPRSAFDPDDVGAQKRMVREAFVGTGWEMPRLIRAMESAEDFYADVTTQIHMARRHVGRVVLVGDAGYCASPLTGQGTSLALVGAYALAAALAASPSDLPRALAAYDALVGPFAETNQRLAERIGRGFAPQTRWELVTRQLVLRLLPYLPGTSAVMSWAMRPVRVAARAITLPDLRAPAAARATADHAPA